ncbi:MAG: hypothetical protein ACE5ID_00370, partial [Acidobacteriota bacterium]
VRYARREGLRILQEAYRRLSHGAGRAMEREKDPIGRFLRTYLKNHPDAGWRDVVKDTEEVRQESLAWILRTRRKRVRDRAIRITLEVDAFRALGDQWRELGYPFERLVPSLATALGSSADRPDSLALLAGIIQNDGVRLEIRRIESFKFGEATPYETHLAPRPGKAIRVMPREVAEVVWKAMRQVVVAGTARRLDEAETLTDGSPRVVAGKTGTGDHRFRRFDSRGNEVSSRPVDRAATFVFTLGDRFFGTVTAYVAGQESGSYQFTSALPVALLGVLLPHLEPLLAAGEALPAGDPRGHARRKTAPWGNVWNPELKADLLTAQPRAGI